MNWNRTAHPKDEDLSAYLDGELRGAEHAAMNRHVDGCERCRSLLDGLSTAKAALAALPRETPRRSFQIAPQMKPARRSLIPAWTPAAALTVFLLLVAVDVGPFGGSSDDSATGGGALAGRAANESAGKAADAPSTQGDAFSSGTTVPAIAGATTTAPSAEAQRQQPNVPPAATTQQGEASSQADRDDSGGELGTLTLDDEDDGRSLTTLNLLEGVFLALFLGSMLGLYVWPRFIRKGT